MNCFRFKKVIWKSRRRDSPSVFELVLGCRPFALEEGQSCCFRVIGVAVEVLVGYQRDQECRFILAFTLAVAEEY